MSSSPGGGVSVGPVWAKLERHFKHAARGGELRSTSLAALATGTGTLAALAVEPRGSAALGLVAFAPLLAAVARGAPRALLFAGCWAGTLYVLVSHRFLPGAVAGPMNLSGAEAWSAFALFALYRGVPWGLSAWAGAAVARRGGRGPLLAAAAFTALELAWPPLLPFAFGAALASRLELLQLADTFGPSGPTLLALLCAAALAEAASRREPATLALGVLGLSFAFAYGSARMASVDGDVARAQSLTASLVQPAHEGRGARAVLGAELASSGEAAADLTIWPEAALPRALPEADASALASALFTSPNGPVLIGALESKQGALSNVALLLEPGGAIAGRYEKRELVPLAEPAQGSWVGAWLGLRRHRRGGEHPPLEIGGARLTVTICFEALVSPYVREQVKSTRGRAIVNLANDGWFRDANEPELHLLSSRLRAIETRRSVLRAANDGVTAAIDPAGRELSRLPGRAPGALTVTVPLMDEETVYVRWGAAPLSLVLAALAAFAARAQRRDSEAASREEVARR